MDNTHSLISMFPQAIASELVQIPPVLWKNGEELRFRIGHPALLISSGKEYRISGQSLNNVKQDLLNDIINRFLNYSDHAHLDELRQGYVMLTGGHRAGFCGHAVVENNQIQLIRPITSINIRLAKDIPDCDKEIWPQLFHPKNGFGNTLIVSPPGCGKTTLLRCLIRHLSETGYTISVCDERSEISGTGPNGFSFDLGPRTDILTGCSKEEGLLLLLRSMGPQILATDELGSANEIDILQRGVISGIKLLVTVHGKDLSDVIHGPVGKLIRKNMIQRIIFLTDVPRKGTIHGIWKSEETERRN